MSEKFVLFSLSVEIPVAAIRDLIQFANHAIVSGKDEEDLEEATQTVGSWLEDLEKMRER